MAVAKHHWTLLKIHESNLYFSIEPVFRTPLASGATVHSLAPTASANLESSSPGVIYSTNSIATTTKIISPSPSVTTATATKTQSASNPSRVPGNRRQDPGGMEMNRLSTLEIVLIAGCGGLTAVVIGLAVRLCTLKNQRSVRFASFSVSFFKLIRCSSCMGVSNGKWDWRFVFLSKPIILWVYFIKDHEISYSAFERVSHVTCYSWFKPAEKSCCIWFKSSRFENFSLTNDKTLICNTRDSFQSDKMISATLKLYIHFSKGLSQSVSFLITEVNSKNRAPGC